MRPTDVALRLNRLAEQAGVNVKLRRVLENVDLVAQAAIDAEMTYVTKKGDVVTVAAPQWSVALNAQKLAAQLLGLEGDAASTEIGETVLQRMQREIAAQGNGAAKS